MKLLRVSPIHGWRAFWGEVGIIVLGVLIALGAQQLVSDWNDRQRARRAMAAVRTELETHDRGFVAFAATAPCVYAQLDAIAQKLRNGDTTPLTLYRDDAISNGFVVRMPSFSFSGSAWQAIDGIDTMRLLDPDLVDLASSYYGRMENLRRFNLDAVEKSASLNALASLMPSDSGDRLHYLEMIEQLREDVSRLVLAADQMRAQQAEMEMATPIKANQNWIAQSGTVKFCRAHGLPLAEVKDAVADG